MPVSDSQFVPHPVEWTEGKIARFWDVRGELPSSKDTYFSWQVGDSLLDLVSTVTPLRRARVLDYGAGPGFLVDKLLTRGIATTAIDTSPASIAALQRRLRNRSAFQGALVSGGLPIPVKDDTYDLVFFLETLEHLLPEEVLPTLKELRRIIRPRGYLVITTPNEEKLEEFQNVCPDCGARYHYMQHLTSWSTLTLANLLRDSELDAVFVKAISLTRSSPLDRARGVIARLLRRRPLNLVAVARK